MVEIGLERVEEGDELGMYHIVYIRQIDASHRFVHPPPKRIHVTVCQRQEAGLLRPADFTMVRDDIVAELRLRKQERLDRLHLGRLVRLVCLPSAFAASAPGQAHGAMLLLSRVAGTEGALDVLRAIIGKRLDRPCDGLRLRHAIEVEEVAGAHDIFVMVARLIADSFVLQPFSGHLGRLARRCGIASRFRLPSFRPTRFRGGSRRQLDLERQGFRIVIGVRIISRTADPFGILATAVVFQPGEAGEKFVTLSVALLVDPERLPIGRVGVRDGTAVFKEKSVNDAQPPSADRVVGQKDMGVGTDRRKSLRHPFFRYMIQIAKAQTGISLDMHALPASFASHGGSEGGA